MQPIKPFRNFPAADSAVLWFPVWHICKAFNLTPVFDQNIQLDMLFVTTADFFHKSAFIVDNTVIHFGHILFAVNRSVRLALYLIVTLVKFLHLEWNTVLFKIGFYVVVLFLPAVKDINSFFANRQGLSPHIPLFGVYLAVVYSSYNIIL